MKFELHKGRKNGLGGAELNLTWHEITHSLLTNKTRVEVRRVRKDIAATAMKSLTCYQTNNQSIVRRDTTVPA